MDIQIIERQLSIYVNEEGQRDKILASAQVFLDGKRCHMYSIIGCKFIENAKQITNELALRGIETIEGSMIPAVSVVFKRLFGDALQVVGPINYGNGVLLDYVVLNIKPPAV